METEKGTERKATRPMNWNDWVWNPHYKGSLAAAQQTTVTVEQVYESSLGDLGAIVAVSRNDTGHFLYSIPKQRQAADCDVLGVNNYQQLQGKTLEAYVNGTTLVAFRGKAPKPIESWNGVL